MFVVLQNHPKDIRPFEHSENNLTLLIRLILWQAPSFDAGRRIRHIRANGALAPSSLVPQIIREKCLLALIS
jgi:hypothetical protein